MLAITNLTYQIVLRCNYCVIFIDRLWNYICSQININVPGSETQSIFDTVFSKMVAAAQPIPGFRRVKGGIVISYL